MSNIISPNPQRPAAVSNSSNSSVQLEDKMSNVNIASTFTTPGESGVLECARLQEWDEEITQGLCRSHLSAKAESGVFWHLAVAACGTHALIPVGVSESMEDNETLKPVLTVFSVHSRYSTTFAPRFPSASIAAAVWQAQGRYCRFRILGNCIGEDCRGERCIAPR